MVSFLIRIRRKSNFKSSHVRNCKCIALRDIPITHDNSVQAFCFDRSIRHLGSYLLDQYRECTSLKLIKKAINQLNEMQIRELLNGVH